VAGDYNAVKKGKVEPISVRNWLRRCYGCANTARLSAQSRKEAADLSHSPMRLSGVAEDTEKL